MSLEVTENNHLELQISLVGDMTGDIKPMSPMLVKCLPTQSLYRQNCQCCIPSFPHSFDSVSVTSFEETLMKHKQTFSYPLNELNITSINNKHFLHYKELS